MNEECLICKAPLEYLETEVVMECAICHKKESSNTRCVNGHYVCNSCHEKGVENILGFCNSTKSKNPVEIFEALVSMPFCHMHGPEHHILVGASLLTAYANAGGQINLERALLTMLDRGKNVPGGACGFWGACGAAISAGIFISIVTGSSPLSEDSYGLSNTMTSKVLAKIGAIGGPRCCKRNSYISILTAVDFAKEKLGVEMKKQNVLCSRVELNNQCIKSRCPFMPKE